MDQTTIPCFLYLDPILAQRFPMLLTECFLQSFPRQVGSRSSGQVAFQSLSLILEIKTFQRSACSHQILLAIATTFFAAIIEIKA
jgi:hypothetical protein